MVVAAADGRRAHGVTGHLKGKARDLGEACPGGVTAGIAVAVAARVRMRRRRSRQVSQAGQRGSAGEKRHWHAGPGYQGLQKERAPLLRQTAACWTAHWAEE